MLGYIARRGVVEPGRMIPPRGSPNADSAAPRNADEPRSAARSPVVRERRTPDLGCPGHGSASRGSRMDGTLPKMTTALMDNTTKITIGTIHAPSP